MFKATREIYEALQKEDGLKVFTDEEERFSEVWLRFPLKNGGGYRIRFISTDDDNDVEVRIYALAQISEEKMPQMLQMINELNNRYRFVKFVIDNDGDLNVISDYLVDRENLASSAVELVRRCVWIIDEVYPRIMRTLWAD